MKVTPRDEHPPASTFGAACREARRNDIACGAVPPGPMRAALLLATLVLSGGLATTAPRVADDAEPPTGVPTPDPGRQELARHADVPRYDVLPRAAFAPPETKLRAGTWIRHLGGIPLEVVTADDETVVIRRAALDGERFPIACAPGLQLVGAGTGGGKVRYALDAPEGRFHAREGCHALGRRLEPGCHAVREARDGARVVERCADTFGATRGEAGKNDIVYRGLRSARRSP